MGEAHLWFGEDLPLPPEPKELYVDLKSRAKKKDRVSGYLIIQSSYSNPRDGQEPVVASAPSSLLRRASSSVESAARAIARSELVQVSASGRREIKIPTNGIEKFISFRELPHFSEDETTSMLPEDKKQVGYNSKIALWLITCCALAYKTEDIVKSVCLNVWGMFYGGFCILNVLTYEDMCGFEFINNEESDTQGFCMFNEHVLVVCFRGTESVRDWITNLNFFQVRLLKTDSKRVTDCLSGQTS